MTSRVSDAAGHTPFRDVLDIGTGWRVAAASGVCLVFGPSVVLYMCFGVFAPALRQQFGWDVGAISFGGTIIALMVMLVSPLQGHWADRFGSRKLILGCIPLFALGIGSLALMNGDIRLFYAGCALLPVLGLGLWPLSFMRAVSTWFDRRLGLALGVTTAGIGVGAAVVPLLIGAALAHHGWRSAYLMLAGILLLVVWPVAALFIREGRSRPGSPRGAAAMGNADMGLTMSSAARTGSFWILLCAFLLLGAISSAILIHQTNILIAHGLALQQAIYLQSALGIASIVGRFAAGWLLDRVRISRLMPVLLVATATACGLYSSDVPGWLLPPSAVMFGLLIGAEFDVLGYAIRRYFGLRAFGTIFGFIFSVFQLGSAIGTAGVGLSHRINSSYAYGLDALGVSGVIAAILFALLGAYRFEARGHELA